MDGGEGEGWRGRGISVAFELFSSPKSREFDQCRTYARTPPPLLPSKYWKQLCTAHLLSEPFVK